MTAKSKSALKEFLSYYQARIDPKYAVLVVGEWGVGKTHQVRAILKEDQSIYVSMFGLATSDEVHAAIYAQMFPGRALVKKFAKIADSATANVSTLGSFGMNGLVSGIVGAALRQEISSAKTIIFDDLERSKLKLKEKLGLINIYVEHHNCRVIVIAHDEGLTRSFTNVKEKIFGQTIRVQADAESAFQAFHDDLPVGPGINFVLEHRAQIMSLFGESGVNSLRILRHVMQDVHRLASVLSPKHSSNKDAMAELVRLFVSLDFEWRAGRISSQDMANREAAILKFGMLRAGNSDDSSPEPPISISQKRYVSVNFRSTILQDRVVQQLFHLGVYDPDAIATSLESSHYFLKESEAPAWMIVSNLDTLEEDVLAKGLDRMNKQFADREVTESGEMLHIFALRLMLADKGVLNINLDEAERECISYVDDLLAKKLLPPRELDWDWTDGFERASHGYVYWGADGKNKDRFDRIKQYLIEARETALQDRFPVIAAEILEIVKGDGGRLFEVLCNTRSGSDKFVSVPILPTIPPSQFVDVWLQSPKKNWHDIYSALSERSKRELGMNEERAWFEAVVSLMQGRLAGLSGIERLRLERAIPSIPQSNNPSGA